MTSQFLGEITVTAESMLPATDQQAGSQISTLEEVNTLFTGWVQMVYQHTVHSTI